MEGRARDGEHGSAVVTSIEEPVHEVHRAGSCRGHAHTEPASVLGIAAGHERRSFFVSDTEITDPVLAFAQRLDE